MTYLYNVNYTSVYIKFWHTSYIFPGSLYMIGLSMIITWLLMREFLRTNFILSFKDHLIWMEWRGGVPFIGLTPPHCCAYPKPGPGFHMLWIFLCLMIWGDMWLFVLLILFKLSFHNGAWKGTVLLFWQHNFHIKALINTMISTMYSNIKI